MHNKNFAVYIMANASLTLYVGMTNDLVRRVWEHKNKSNPNCFTARYGLFKLVYFEVTDQAQSAIYREKQMKRLGRAEKLRLIQSVNPAFRDLYPEITG